MADSLYDEVGPSFFVSLVDAFYERVARDDLLRPMYPEDLTDAKRHLTLFLAQYWGGPSTYSHERGHPRLRMRHVPFTITPAARDAWIAAMDGALDTVRDRVSAGRFDELREYLTSVARQLRNA
ncbi:MAG: globin [Acidimicrobiales bacterium]